MNNDMFSISVEQFAAYLDGNLIPEEMNEMESMISANPEFQDIVVQSDTIDTNELIDIYDDTSLQTDIFMLDEADIEIPQIEFDLTLTEELNTASGIINENPEIEYEESEPINTHQNFDVFEHDIVDMNTMGDVPNNGIEIEDNSITDLFNP